jgi:serine O-acetyltransferase
MFLYRLSNILYNETSDRTIPTKLFLLNKLLHGIDIFYEINLPDIFILNHPVGTVLGRGNYADYLIVCQRCTVGNNRGIYPTFGKFTTLYPGATVLGNCNIGENCAIASESFLLDTNLKSDSLYIGNPQSYVIKNNPAQTRWKTA